MASRQLADDRGGILAVKVVDYQPTLDKKFGRRPLARNAKYTRRNRESYTLLPTPLSWEQSTKPHENTFKKLLLAVILISSINLIPVISKMPVITVKNSTEKYQAIAKHLSHRNELTGRGERIEITKRRISFIKHNLILLNRSFKAFADVGCGDGSFLEELSQLSINSYGILPTTEEIYVVQKILGKNIKNTLLYQGLSNNLPFPDGAIDLLLCNSVLHGIGFDAQLVEESIKEFSRVQPNNGVLYIGEIPELNEMEGRNYGTSFFKYLSWTIRIRGFQAALQSLLQYLKCAFSTEIYTILPTNMFFCEKHKFTKILNSHQYKVIGVYESNTNKKVDDEDPIAHRRLDYLCIKSS